MNGTSLKAQGHGLSHAKHYIEFLNSQFIFSSQENIGTTAERLPRVTSHYENPEIMARCQSLDIRLLPKNLLAHICITLETPPVKETIDCVLIDDDAMMHSVWQMCAKMARKKLICFESPQIFEQKTMAQLDKDTPIYIDSNLGEGYETGQAYAKQLFEKGFTNLYLATGYHPSHFNPMPWVKGIVAKEPPF